MAGGTDGLHEPMSRRDFLRLPQLFGRRVAERLQEVPPAAAPTQPEPSLLPHDLRETVDVGTPELLAQVAAGAVLTQYAARGRFYLVRVPEGVLALVRVCRENGCAVMWQGSGSATPTDQARGWAAGRFFCLQHQAAYDRYGQPADSKAPGPLDAFVVRQHGGRVLVDTAAPVPRSWREDGDMYGVLPLEPSPASKPAPNE